MAHWAGYCAVNHKRVLYTNMVTTIGEGDRVSFTRGMFGMWSGTVERLGIARKGSALGEGSPFAYVRITRRNGTRGVYRVPITGLVLLRKAVSLGFNA